jgi:hypothetical protein
VLVLANADEQVLDRVETGPQQRGKPPAGDAPPEQRDDRQEQQEHERSAGRGQHVVRLRAGRREEGAEHQVVVP